MQADKKHQVFKWRLANTNLYDQIRTGLGPMLSLLKIVACNPFTFLSFSVHLGLPLADLQLDWRELHTILQEQLTDLVTLEFETVTETSGAQMIVKLNKWVNMSTACEGWRRNQHECLCM